MELGKRNLIQVLAFDSKSIRALLDESHSHYFETDFPLIYKLSSQDLKCDSSINPYEKVSAIDCALKNNQVVATKLMIDHIIKHQNSYVQSYLFANNLVLIMEMGIEVAALFNSAVFCYDFDFTEWPTIH